MLRKGVAANKTDEDEPEEEPEVRRSSRLAEKSPVSFEDLFLPPETPLPFGQESTLGETPETPGYQPFAIHRNQAQCKEEDDSLRKLNEFLVSRDCSTSPVRYRVRGMLSEAAEHTKREHLRKVRQGIVAVVETIAPGQEDETWEELTRSGILDAAQFNARKMGRMQIEADHSIHALAAAYRQSEARVTKMQILSIIVNIFPQQQIQDLLPEITKYQLFQAKKHLISYGRGQPLPAVPKYRVSVTLPKIDHFIGFLTSPHFVQDVAHGTPTLKLSSGETISIPVVRNMVAARIIEQYVSYCKEIEFNHSSERKLYRVLKYCPAQQKNKSTTGPGQQ